MINWFIQYSNNIENDTYIENDQTPWHRAQVTLATSRTTRMQLAFQVRASISDHQNPVQQEKPLGQWGDH